jgi:hypothetical protein
MHRTVPADGLLLLAKVLVVSSQFLAVGYLAFSHAVDFTTCPL